MHHCENKIHDEQYHRALHNCRNLSFMIIHSLPWHLEDKSYIMQQISLLTCLLLLQVTNQDESHEGGKYIRDITVNTEQSITSANVL